MSSASQNEQKKSPRIWGTLARLLGMGVYKLTVRLAVNLVTAFLALYFLINSGAVAHFASARVSEIIPGRVIVERLRWGPNPGHLQLLRPQIFDAAGKEVLDAQWIALRINWVSLLRKALAGRAGQSITITELRLHEPVIHLVNDKEDNLTLLSALGVGSSSKESPQSSAFELKIPTIHLIRATTIYQHKNIFVDVRQLSAEAAFSLKSPKVGKTHFNYEAHHISAAKVRSVFPGWRQDGIAQLPVFGLRATRIKGGPYQIDTKGLSLTSPLTKALHADLRVQMPPPERGQPLRVDVQGIELQTQTQEAMLQSILGPQYAGSATFKGTVHWSEGGRLQIKAKTQIQGTFAKVELQQATGDLRLDMGHSESQKFELDGENLSFNLYGGQMRCKSASYRLGFDGKSVIELQASMGGVRLAELLRAELVGLSVALPTALTGALSGDLRTRMVFRSETAQHKAIADIDVKGGLTLDRGANTSFLQRIHWAGGLRFSQDPEADSFALKLNIDDSVISDQLNEDGSPMTESKSSWVTTKGALDLHRKT
ncbi:MAG: hypothetical protein CMH53_06890, partial [Myxococcales bacterium]|nr:hypothetical protein [Myxococcales bacterium]